MSRSALFAALSVHAVSALVRPNIVFIMADDYGYNDIGYHNRNFENLLSTPNLDGLAQDGIKLENYYVQPVCTPTRATFLSGRYPIHTGLQHDVIHPKQPFGLSTDLTLLPQHLHKLGYRCHKVGKWHIGFYNNASCPWNRGFGAEEGSDFGFLGGEEDHWTHQASGYLDFRDNGAPDPSDSTTEGGDAARHSTKLYRLKAVSIIEEHAAKYADRPFFLYLAFQAVHGPVQVPAYWKKSFSASDFDNDANRLTYAAMVLELDHAVSKVVESLKEQGLYENTVLVLSSDNGGIQNGKAGAGYNWPLRGQKATIWEGGMHTIGFVHSPLLQNWGYEYKGLLHVADWLPTFVNLAGGDASSIEGLDGHDVWAALVSNESSPRGEILHNINPAAADGAITDAAIRVGSLKLLLASAYNKKHGEHYVPPGCDEQTCTPPVMPMGRGCVADTESTQVWLFDIERDPSEVCNLAHSRPDDVSRLMARLVDYNRTARAPANKGNDPASDPSKRAGSERNVWGPWVPDDDHTSPAALV